MSVCVFYLVVGLCRAIHVCVCDHIKGKPHVSSASLGDKFALARSCVRSCGGGGGGQRWNTDADMSIYTLYLYIYIQCECTKVTSIMSDL